MKKNVNINFLETMYSKIDNNEMEKEINIFINSFNINENLN